MSEKTDYQKSLESIIKKAIKKYIEAFDIKGDIYFKLSYQNVDAEKEFSVKLTLGIEKATIIEIFYEKEYSSYIHKEDIIVDALINMTLGYIKRVDSKVINN